MKRAGLGLGLEDPRQPLSSWVTLTHGDRCT